MGAKFVVVPGRGKVKVEGSEIVSITGKDMQSKPVQRLTPYERTKAQVYATGNKWAIENFHATHG